MSDAPDRSGHTDPQHPLADVSSWPVPAAAAAFRTATGRVGRHGPTDGAFPLASLTKPLFALAILVAVEEGSLELDQPAGPEGSTVRHLLAHTSGLGPDDPSQVATPGTRRIYSNAGFEVLGRLLETTTGISTVDYFREAVCVPLELRATRLEGSPAHGAVSSVDDLVVVIGELFSPTLLDPATIREATSAQFPGVAGVLPGYGRQDPNPWGLGFEIRGTKKPHWTAATNDPSTFGHFGRAGTMFWVDPAAGIACVALTNREFGPWAVNAWPSFSAAVLTAA